jgi:hypothetical protein
MSFSGKLISIEPDGKHSRAALDKPDEFYPVWKITVESEDGQIHTAHSGRQNMLDRWRALIGTKVTVLRGGKEGIVGGVVPWEASRGK